MLKRFGVLLGLAAGAAGGMLEVRGADTAPLIETLRSVDAEGKGAPAAAQAFQTLSKEGPQAIPPLLTALDGANPLASNYLRNAIENIVARTRKTKGALPLAEIEAFLKDTRHEPRARRLAFEILVSTDKANYDRLVPGMLNDPSTELRRDAVIQVMEQGNALFDEDKKDEAKAKYRAAMAAARDDDQVKTLKKYLEELGEKVDLPTHFGFLMTWKLIAPFDNTAGKGFAVAYPPEKELDFTREYEGKEGVKAAWVPTTTDDEYGIVDLAKVLTPFKGSVAYAVAEFDSDAEKAVDLRLGTPNSWKVWLNGKLLFAREEYHRGMNLDQYRMRGTLKKGKNTILVKVCQNEQTEEWAQRWQIQLRICDGTGTAVLSADRKAAPATGGSD
ncbi:MAG: hypothetical protein ACK5EA_11000 [Planctomycetaceae bacterium]|jgi:hypothetical protein